MGSLWAHTGAIGCIVLTKPRVAYPTEIGKPNRQGYSNLQVWIFLPICDHLQEIHHFRWRLALNYSDVNVWLATDLQVHSMLHAR